VAVVGGSRRHRRAAAGGRAAAQDDQAPAGAGGGAAQDPEGSVDVRHRSDMPSATAGLAQSGTVADGLERSADEPLASVRRFDPAASPGRWAGRRRVPLSVAVALAVVAVAALAAAVGFGVAWSGLQQQQQAANQVRTVSRAFVLDLTNLTPQTVDQRVSDLLDASTGAFASQAKAFFDSGNPPVRQALVAAKAVEEGQIRSLDVEAVNGSTASVFAVVDVSYQSAKITSVQSDVLRLSLDLVDTAHGWKVSDVTVLTGGTGGVLAPPGG
jgi:uncharacterized membrane protein affecting hemolysin expression